MRSIKLIHVGDIHFPDRDDHSALDWKDKAISGALINRLKPEPFKIVADALRELLLNDDSVAGILFSGDLTSRGNISGYRECVEFLSTALDMQDSKVWANKVLAVVPGNHDVVRADVDPAGISLHTKLDKASAVWQSVRPDAFHPDCVKVADIPNTGDPVIRVLSLNTCIGCAETRYLPEEIRKEMSSLIHTWVAATPDEKQRFALLGEKLDTPAILEQDLVELEHQLQRLKQPAVGVVLGHHSMLPQPELRIDLYTELINGGRFRNVLASLGSTVIYCHGHIHDDPVEIVTHPARHSGQLVIVSAPLFRDGFNVLEVCFSDDNEPVGCKIYPYRVERFASIRARSPVKIPLQPAGHRATLCGEVSLSILSVIGDRAMRFRELLDVLTLDDATLVSHLELLEWISLVDIRNREDPARHWHISRIGP